MFDSLAGGDITKWAEVEEMNYISCLNLLAYRWEMNEYEKEIHRREMMSLKNK